MAHCGQAYGTFWPQRGRRGTSEEGERWEILTAAFCWAAWTGIGSVAMHRRCVLPGLSAAAKMDGPWKDDR